MNAISARIAHPSREPWLTFAPRKDPEIEAAAMIVPALARSAFRARSCSANAPAVSW
jgi:hypothetical protein